MSRPKKKPPQRVTRKRGSKPKRTSSSRAPARSEKGPIRDQEPGRRGPSPVVQRIERGGVLYQQEFTRCGKKKCHCATVESRGHGPYWYAYPLARKGGGKAGGAGAWTSKYIGVEFREL